jgi:hypothetical protein
MVYCRKCRQQVEDCSHFVAPLNIPPTEVFDPKVKTLAYKNDARILEIAFKNGQVWQLFGVPPDVVHELFHATLSSFLKFLAHRYEAAPVRKPKPAADIPESEPCPQCRTAMMPRTRAGSLDPIRVLWHCAACDRSEWRTYGTTSVRERKGRWH